MLRLFLILALLVVAGCHGSSGTSGQVYRADDGRTSSYSNDWMGDLDEILWKVRLEAPIAGSVAAEKRGVFVGTEDGTVAAYSIDGEPLWVAQLDSEVYGTPVTTSHRLLVGTDGGLTAIGYDGVVQWTFKCGAVEGAPLVRDSVAYFGSRDGKVYAVDLVGGSLIWEGVTAGPVVESAAGLGDTVVFGSGDGGIYALAADTGELRWSWNVGAPVRGLASSDGVVYVTAQHTLAAVSAADPQSATWSVDVASGVTTPPAVDGGRVIVGSGTGELVIVDASSGAPQLKRQLAEVIDGDLHVVNGNVLIPMSNRGVGVFDGKDALSWTFKADGKVSGITPVDGRLYVTDDEGSLYAIR